MTASIDLRRLDARDLDRVVALQTAVTRDVPAGFLRAKSLEQLRAYLDGTDGVAFGIVDGGRLLASALLRLPHRVRPNAGEPFPLVPTADWPLRAAFLEHAMVRREVRGRGYQRALFAARQAHATAAGMRWMCAGARLDNTVSWSNLLASGLVIAGIRFDLGEPVVGLLRACGDPIRVLDGEERLVDVYDAAGHAALADDRWVGVARAPDGRVRYRRLASVATSGSIVAMDGAA